MRNYWWEMVGKTPAAFRDFGVRFMLWMIDHVPGLINRFQVATDNELNPPQFSHMFLAHSQLVLSTLDTLIYKLRQPESLEMSIRSIVLAHVKLEPQVGVEFFQLMRDNIHVLIEDETGVENNSELVGAWWKLFHSIAKVCNEENEKLKLELMRSRKKDQYCSIS